MGGGGGGYLVFKILNNGWGNKGWVIISNVPKRYLKKLLTFDAISREYLWQLYSRTSMSRTIFVVSVSIGMKKWIFKIFQIKKIILILVKSPVDFLFFFSFKGVVKRAELCKCDIRLLSRILWPKRIIPSFKNGDFDIWYSPAAFRHNFSLSC